MEKNREKYGVGLGQTPPPLWEFFPHNHVFFLTASLTYNCAHLKSTKESLTFEYFEKENIFLAEEKKNGGGKEGKYFERKKICFLADEKKNGEGKGGK